VLTQWAAANRTAWITVLPRDRGFGGLARALLRALDALSPGIEVELRPVVASWSPEIGPHEAAWALVDLLNDVLGREPGHISLIVDDASELAQQDTAWDLLDALVRQAPAGLRVLIGSRTQPPIPTQRLRARGELSEIAVATLAFERQDAEHLLRSHVGDVDGSLIARVFDLTQGRPAAVRLVADALARVRSDEHDALLSSITQPGRPLFEYLSEEVFAAEAPESMVLLRSAAILGATEAGISKALGIADSEHRLADLARRGLLHEEPPQSGRFVALEAFQQVMNRSIGRRDAARVRRLAASSLETAGRPLDALAVHLDEPPSVSRTNAVRGLVLRRGREMTGSEGAAATASALIDVGVGGNPLLEATLGEALQFSGDWDGAIQAYQRAATGHVLPAHLTCRWGSLLYLRGQLADSAAVLESTATAGDLADHALVLAWMASVQWARGDMARAKDLAREALAKATAVGSASASAASHVAQALIAASEGNREANLREYERALAYATKARDTLLVTRIEANLSSRHLEEARYGEAIAHADAALRIGVGIPSLAALAEANRAEAMLRLGRLDESLANIQHSRETYSAVRSLYVYRPLTLLGDLCRERGDLTGARAAYLEARALAQRSGDVHGLAPVLSGLALVIAAEDPGQARELADEATRVADARFRPVAAAAAGWVAYMQQDLEAARHFAATAEAAALETTDQAGRAEALELSAACNPEAAGTYLSEAIAIWVTINNPLGEARARLARTVLHPDPRWTAEASVAKDTLVQHGVRLQPAAAGLLAAIVEPGLGVQINTLGSFRVTRDGRTVALAEWPSREAVTLLKLLSAGQGRPVSNTTIAEVLWPEEDERHIAARITDLVNSARSVLDPTRRYPTNHYVTSDANALALTIDHVDLDVAQLLKIAREGLRYIYEQDWGRALPLLQSVEDLYAGDFLDEDAYEPWSADCREQARIAACDASRTLARRAARQADDEGACRHLRRVLERDPHDEEAWLLLMATLVRIRRHGEARRAYAAYARRMNEVGVVPAPFDRSGAAAAPEAAAERLLATVLFTDIVDSTAHVLSIGDRSWRDRLDLHDAMVRHELARHHGREIKTMGDGVLATFDSPARAIACATAVREAVRTLGLDIRCGLHTGEVELRGEDIGGLAVHIAARICRLASPGEVLISRTVRDLLGGSGVTTADRGLHALAGLPDQWQLYAVASQHALPQPPLVSERT